MFPGTQSANLVRRHADRAYFIGVPICYGSGSDSDIFHPDKDAPIIHTCRLPCTRTAEFIMVPHYFQQSALILAKLPASYP
jgi:hypothetical protein